VGSGLREKYGEKRQITLSCIVLKRLISGLKMAVTTRTGKTKKTLTIDFSYRGIRCRESLKGLVVNKANRKFAERKLAVIELEITLGTFNYANHFPDSKRAILLGITKVKDKLLGDAVDEWLAIQGTKISHSTMINYKSKVKTYIKPAFAVQPMSQITQSAIETWIAVDLAHLKNKTINEALIIMRAIFKTAKADKIIPDSPLEFIDNLKVVTDEPDPFTKDEINRILSTPTNRIQEINMIEFNFWSGLRLSELIALGWDDIDQINWTAKIHLAKVNGKFKKTKTERAERTIELLKPAIDAIKKQISFTYMFPSIKIEVTQRDIKTVKIIDWRPVFLNSNTQEPHASDIAIRTRFWTAHLKRAKVRYRAPKNTRHTYASQLLSTGTISKDWIAKQMGHTSTKMIDKHYAKWIPEDAPPMAKMANKALGFLEQSVTNASQKK